MRRTGPLRGEASTPLHEERLDAVMEHLLADGVETVLDLGCGAGALLRRLVREPRVRRVVGIDRSPSALLTARAAIRETGADDARLTLREGDVTALDADLGDFDAAAMVEILEHPEPGHLSRLERGLFGRLAPGRIVITTPNREYNALYGLAEDELRHPHHRFEWDRRRFERWAAGVARRTGYGVAFEGVGPGNAWFGNATQMAVFEKFPTLSGGGRRR